MNFNRALVAGIIFTFGMLLFLATGLVEGGLELFLWAVALVLGWIWLLRMAGPPGTR